jgi:hypothetical protein
MTQSESTASQFRELTVTIVGLGLFIQGVTSYRDPDTTFTALLIGGGAALMAIGVRSFWKARARPVTADALRRRNCGSAQT